MRNLDQVPNIGTGSPATYPDGVVVDEVQGSITGTGVTEILYGDLIQTVHKLKRLANITPNNQPDNETNGFQMLTSFLANMVPIWQRNDTNIDLSLTKFVVFNNGLYYHRTANNTNNDPSIDTTNWFRVLFWNGSTIVFSDESRIAGIESNVSTNASDIDALETENATQGAAITSLQNTVNNHGPRINALEADTGWLNCERRTGASSTGFNVRARQMGKTVIVKGSFELAIAGANLFDLPGVIDTPNEGVLFPGTNITQEASFAGEVAANSRNASSIAGTDTSRVYYINFSFFVD